MWMRNILASLVLLAGCVRDKPAIPARELFSSFSYLGTSSSIEMLPKVVSRPVPEPWPTLQPSVVHAFIPVEKQDPLFVGGELLPGKLRKHGFSIDAAPWEGSPITYLENGPAFTIRFHKQSCRGVIDAYPQRDASDRTVEVYVLFVNDACDITSH
jgi:hypothetical protein